MQKQNKKPLKDLAMVSESSKKIQILLEPQQMMGVLTPGSAQQDPLLGPLGWMRKTSPSTSSSLPPLPSPPPLLPSPSPPIALL